MTSGANYEQERLAAELRTLRDRAGLSLNALAKRTTASKSSWHRYMTGAQVPPAAVVKELCALVRHPDGPLLAMRDLAENSSTDAGPPEVSAVVRSLPHDHTSPARPADPHLADAATPSDASSQGEEASAGPSGPVTAERQKPKRTHTRILAAMGALAAALASAAALHQFDWSNTEAAPPRPGCAGTSCTGRHSLPMACAINGSGVRTVAVPRPSKTGTAVVDVRYSPACDATWARMWFGKIGDRVEIRLPGQKKQLAEITDRFDAESYLSTPMVGGGPDGITLCLWHRASTEPDCLNL
ncbi:helix-turn-helix domain-containing protein [Streptomyces pakalii]|uniref:Helix-turn-helix domain-containing protein n=1 Tax=Streptomyces pakalii TaxID=3036494 RepID=A0ABT7DHJ3_9ACTN|nr:XRE family transcriptional regulator [Streptomyces pakalii]MDJ1645286.1 helix-turn-helix domain-containing protein [Streptomyces pakalii]